jgi:cytochrome c5
MIAAAAATGAESEVLERIRPIGKVNVAEPEAPAAPAPAQPEPAEQAASAAPAPPAEAAPPPQQAAAAEEAAATVAAAAPDGKQIYAQYCQVCHAAGAAGAPKLGDAVAWEPRTAKGVEALLQSAVNGVPGTAMPPKGTCAPCSEADLQAAVEYMLSQVE